jgi:hypothetical protein
MADYSATLRIPGPCAPRAGRCANDGLTGHRLLHAKLDFKRAPDGALRILEFNPRFNLWHYPGALGGGSLPALVHALGRLAGAPDHACGA